MTGRGRAGGGGLGMVWRAPGLRRGEIAGLPEQEDLLQAAEDAAQDRHDQGVQSSGQHSASIVCCGGGA